MGVLTIVRPGMLTTVQDLGRWGYQSRGVPVSGALDWFSHRLANRLLGNDDGVATLEATLIGPQLRFRARNRVCGHRRRVSPDVGRESCRDESDGRGQIGVGAEIWRAAARRSCVHLGVGRGRRAPGSRQPFDARPHPHGWPSGKAALRSGDVLDQGKRRRNGVGRGFRVDRSKTPPDPVSHRPLRVIVADAQLAGHLTINGSGFLLNPTAWGTGSRLRRSRPPLAESSSLQPCPRGPSSSADGTADSADERPCDHWGYAVAATVITADLPLAGQLAPGDWVDFEACSLETADEALRRREAALGE